MFGNSNLTKDASFENTLFASFPSNLIGIRPSHRKICPHGDYTQIRMSFFTTLSFYRPTKPPQVTGSALAEFIQRFDQLGIASIYGKLHISVKFGKAIDADDKPTTWLELLGSGISVTESIRWDVQEACTTLPEVAEALTRHDETIYRAHIELGVVTDPVGAVVQRIGSPENKTDLTLDSWSLEIGPIQSHRI